MRYQGSSADQGIRTYLDSAHDYCPAADRRTLSYDGRFEKPVSFFLRGAVGIRRTRMPIIYENHAMANEHIVLDAHAGADKGMTGYLAISPDPHLLLNFDKSAHSGIVPYLTAV
jgi:hypothetical protein